MPFNVWCEGCGHLIGKGVRFNAEKQEIGKYHSTKIWSFTMTAPCCQQRIEVQTDPKNAQYNVVSGGKRKVSNDTYLEQSAHGAVADVFAELVAAVVLSNNQNPFVCITECQTNSAFLPDRVYTFVKHFATYTAAYTHALMHM